ncbi:hypothetical protein D3C78_1534070 [compost metagenome]
MKVVRFQPGIHRRAIGQIPGLQCLHRDEGEVDTRMLNPLTYCLYLCLIFQIRQDEDSLCTGLVQPGDKGIDVLRQQVAATLGIDHRRNQLVATVAQQIFEDGRLDYDPLAGPFYDKACLHHGSPPSNRLLSQAVSSGICVLSTPALIAA